jgi:outer membrane protein TolC
MTNRRGSRWGSGIVAALEISLLLGPAARGDEPLPEGARLPQAVDDFSGERVGFAAAIERALQQNPQLTIASQEVIRARALMEQTAAASLPTLAGSGTYTRYDGDRKLSGAVIQGENTVSANVALSVPIVASKSWVAWSHAHDNVKVAALSYDEARRQLALLAARAYLTVLTQKRLLEVARVARDAARQQHAFAQARLSGGVGNRLDEVRAAQEQATDEALLTTAITSLRRAREALGVVIAADGPLDAVEEPALDQRGSMNDALADVERRRPDVLAAVSRQRAAHHATRDSFTDYLPYLTGVFEPFYQNPPTLTVPQTGWMAQLILTAPIYDGGLRYGQRRERSALEREARAQLEATLRQARSEVRVAFEAVREADEALLSAHQAAKLAKEALELAITAYRAGTTTNLELIDAERQSRNAAAEAALAEDTARQARLELLTAAGHFPDAR